MRWTVKASASSATSAGKSSRPCAVDDSTAVRLSVPDGEAKARCLASRLLRFADGTREGSAVRGAQHAEVRHEIAGDRRAVAGREDHGTHGVDAIEHALEIRLGRHAVEGPIELQRERAAIVF